MRFRRSSETIDPPESRLGGSRAGAGAGRGRHAPERTGGGRIGAWKTPDRLAFLTLQATGLGLAVRRCEGAFDPARRGRLRRAGDFEPVVAMAVGYAGDPDLLPTDRQRDAERLPRKRQPIDEFVFEGTWGKTLTSTP
jgi:hypothetical protein